MAGRCVGSVAEVPLLRLILILVILAIVAGAAFVGWSHFRWSAAINADVQRVLQFRDGWRVTVDEEMIRDLPEPARRYFAYAGVVGRTIPVTVRLKQTGRIRSSLEASWLDLEAEEFFSTSPPNFVWRAVFPKPSLPLVMGRDEYLDGKGSIAMKLLGVVTVANERTNELAAAGLMRYLNEMMWFPAAYLGGNVTIELVEANSFQVTIADRGLSATATLTIDAEGKLVNFRALRFNTGTRAMEAWETPISGYGTFAGLRLPAAGKAVWKLASGDVEYIDLTITEVAYDEPPLQ